MKKKVSTCASHAAMSKRGKSFCGWKKRRLPSTGLASRNSAYLQKEANRITLNLQNLHLHLQFCMRKLWSKSRKSGQSGSVINNAKT
jgi:hypothetical protein